ncbi:MAG: FtsW/RodA/SpoVE family cell cycle protein [Candidatus Saccharimonadales bacterium]
MPRRSAPSRSQTDETESVLPRRHRPDYWLVVLMVILLAIGLVVIYSISPALSLTSHVGANYFIDKQLLAVGLGFVGFFIAALVPFRYWRNWVFGLLVVAGLVTLAALVMPVNPAYPAHRWIRLGGFSFQSVELVTFALMIWAAKLLSNRMREGQIKNFKLTVVPILIAVLVVGAVVAGAQSDLGSLGVIVAMLFSMVLIAGVPMKRLLILSGIALVLALLAISATPYRRARLATFLHPQSNCKSASSYQACQAIIAVGSGGVAGLGLGRSVQAYGYLPEADNDSVFAIFAEKFGFIGSLVLMVLFVAFFSRLKRIVERAPDNFTRLAVIGVLAWLSVQTFINIAGMIGLFPLKGITLPFISYGGTSLVMTMAVVGFVFQISRYTTHTALAAAQTEGNKHGSQKSRNSSLDRRRLGRAYNTARSSR